MNSSTRAPARHWRALLGAAALALGVTVCGMAATAQPKEPGPRNALQGFAQNRDQPVRIQATSLEVREKDKVATFTGDVHVVNGDTEMRCKSLQVFYEEETTGKGGTKVADAAGAGPNGAQQIKRIEAKGGVAVKQKEQHATGDSAIFDMRENTVTLLGNVVVTRGQDVLRGPRLVVNLTSGVSEMKAEAGRRIDVLIVPKSAPEKK